MTWRIARWNRAGAGRIPVRLTQQAYARTVAALATKIDRVLAALETEFGAIALPKRARAFDLLVLANCGYPASELACAKGWAALRTSVGTTVAAILGAPRAKLAKAMRAGGIVPEVRADRLVEVATRVEAGADLRDRKTLEKFPTIGRPGADKILLFTRVEAIAAVPSNATQAPLRIGFGAERASYAQSYRSVQEALDAALPKTFDARLRAYVLLKRHGQDVCKRSMPRCDQCPLTRDCDYFAKL